MKMNVSLDINNAKILLQEDVNSRQVFLQY